MGHEAILYLDEKHRGNESEHYMRRVLDPDKEDCTMESYRAKALQFGTLMLLNASGKDPEQAYLDYKTRGDVEQTIDGFKNILEADHSYMQDEKSLEALMFINLIDLQWYYSLIVGLRGRADEQIRCDGHGAQTEPRKSGPSRPEMIRGRSDEEGPAAA